ncbi:MAG: hypothetical protein ACE5OZ_04345 [Candidatus Heimdallarchaeota archaeon]
MSDTSFSARMHHVTGSAPPPPSFFRGERHKPRKRPDANGRDPPPSSVVVPLQGPSGVFHPPKVIVSRLLPTTR